MAIDERENGSAVTEEDRGVSEERDDERDVRDLEAEVREMADIIEKSRSALPGRLAEALSKQLSAQRPRAVVDGALGSQDYVSRNENEVDTGKSIPDLDEETQKKLQTLRTKLRCNIETMPQILKRIKGCVQRVNNLAQSSGTINPVFKKRRKISQSCL